METILMELLRNFDLRDTQYNFLEAGFARFKQKTYGKFPLTIETFVQQVREKIEKSSYVFDIVFDNEVEGDFYPRALNLEIEEF